jgi:type IV pilus assembly protein PilM
MDLSLSDQNFRTRKRTLTIASSVSSLLGRASTRMLGLDLTPACVQLVELQQFKSGHWALQACATEPLAPGCLQDGNIENHEETVAAVRRLLAKNRTATKAVAMALPDTAVIAKRVGVSAALSPAQIALQVEFEADRHIPFERSEICLDHCIIGPCADDAQTVDVLLVAARQARVQALQNLTQAVGLVLHVLDVASYAAHRAAARVLCLEPRWRAAVGGAGGVGAVAHAFASDSRRPGGVHARSKFGLVWCAAAH